MAEVVLIASGGGHLQQLCYLADRLPYTAQRRWITFDTPQSRSLLADEEVDFVPYMAPRDVRGLAQNFARSRSLRPSNDTEAVVSTGAGLALAHLPFSAARGIPTHYIESATRVTGPSMTGRILARVPKVNMHTQYERWAGGKWSFGGSVFDGFQAVETATRPRISKAVVSLGTIRPYGFRRLVEYLTKIFEPDTEVIWQVGATDVQGLGIDARSEIPHHELVEAIKSADVLVAHAGTGIALTALQAGVCPVLVPREAAHGEHVDDHQQEIANLLGRSGLSVSRQLHELAYEDLLLASSRSITINRNASPLRLDGAESQPTAPFPVQRTTV